jgi:HSP20 family molecular chaperone IbpA
VDRSGYAWRRLFSEEWDVDSWPKVEEFRDGDELVVRVELPDVDPDKDVELTVEDGVLTLRAERSVSSEHKEKDRCRSSSAMARSPGRSHCLRGPRRTT